MKLTAKPCAFDDIRAWRDLYRAEMPGQIVHDSLHAREGWAQPYRLESAAERVGYGSVLVGGPWSGSRTVFEFYILPAHRNRIFELFDVLLTSSGATAIQAQTSDALLAAMLHARANDIRSEKIIFEDRMLTQLPAGGLAVRKTRPEDTPAIFAHQREPIGDTLLLLGEEIVATGGVAWHYNRPYGDLFLEVDGGYRSRGYGSYLVQELKRLCYEAGGIPCARCDTGDAASMGTLQRAGMIPTAHLLIGTVPNRG